MQSSYTLRWQNNLGPASTIRVLKLPIPSAVRPPALPSVARNADAPSLRLCTISVFLTALAAFAIEITLGVSRESSNQRGLLRGTRPFERSTSEQETERVIDRILDCLGLFERLIRT